jgi:hypothetical protein
MNLWQLSLEEVIIRYMPEPPPPSQDAPAIIKEKPMPIFPSGAAEPFKYGQLHKLNDAYKVWDNKGKGSCTYFASIKLLHQTGRVGIDVDIGNFKR